MAVLRLKLNQWLDKANGKPFEWGQSDCVLEVLDWIDFVCKTSLAQELRGTYATEQQAYELMPDGLEAAMRAKAIAEGIETTIQPVPGDVALVALAGQDKPMAAILMPSERWRMKTEHGIALTKAVTVIVAWRLPLPKPRKK